MPSGEALLEDGFCKNGAFTMNMKKRPAVLSKVLFVPALAICMAGIPSVFGQNDPVIPSSPGQSQPNPPKPGMPGPTNPNGNPERNNRRPGEHTPDATPTPTPNAPDGSKTPAPTPVPETPPNTPSRQNLRG
jgi:hypothetical protein